MLKIAIIGSGFGQYGLLPAFNSVKNCQVVAICGTKRPQLIEYCKRIGFTNIYSDWKTLLENEELDAIALAVTPKAQYTIAQAAIKKGLHVFAEKPLSANLKQAKKLCSLAQKAKIITCVDFIFPEIAEWEKVKQLLDKKTFGKLVHISTNWEFVSYLIKNRNTTWKNQPSEGGGALSYYFSHGLNYLEYFAGSITEIKSNFNYLPNNKIKGEIGVDMLLKFKNKVTGSARIYINSRDSNSHRLLFECEKGLIVLENSSKQFTNFNLITYSSNGKKAVLVKKDKQIKNEDERVKVIKKIATKFVKSCILNKPMHPSFKEGLRVQELIAQVRASKI